nr:hypothetical protein Aca09nite_18630 [Actinoplanes campanulatus]
MDRLDKRANPLDGNGDVELGTGQQTARVPAGAAQVDPIQHATQSRLPPNRVCVRDSPGPGVETPARRAGLTMVGWGLG